MTVNHVVTLDGPSGPVRVAEQPLPAVEAGQLLVRVELGGVCATDLHIYQGDIPDFGYPATLGHELVGTVEQIGDGLTSDTAGRTLRRGDRVAVMPATPCGRCPACRRAPRIPDCDDFDVIGFADPSTRPAGGGWGRYVLCNSSRARFFVTEAAADAAVLTEPAATPMEGMRRAGVAFGDSVLVQGTGTIGLLAIATARALGASRIVAIGGPARRLEIARSLGAAETIDIADHADGAERIGRAVAASPEGLGFDAVIECAGVPSTLPEGLSCLRKGGTYIELGHFSDVGDAAVNPYRHLLSRDATLIAVSGYTPDSFRRALRVVEGLGDRVADLVTHRVPLSRAEDAMLALTAERRYELDGAEVGKIVIDPWS
ncbi:zinc-dependent alcohol dehydrogenase [Actinomadura violacea]|uniref:Alcohol dehydrogenase catalytic domain-containing protein n=1 Tax=Actinomadura violacea TaxID=2819934 RepID=A0ABS3SA26_9ACTN|nr:alcohol dehydrogenase catalytic domain-containing protein [Actinomadura violacea]MBO2465413.1 alcohol dehydrogenase catalytic domain-containing protein [Actinomadura violacea]